MYAENTPPEYQYADIFTEEALACDVLVFHPKFLMNLEDILFWWALESVVLYNMCVVSKIECSIIFLCVCVCETLLQGTVIYLENLNACKPSY